MQEKESVNFFYYLSSMKIKKYQKEQVLNIKKKQPANESLKTKSSVSLTKTF